MPKISHLREIFLFLIDPWLFMLQSLSYLPRTVLTLLLTLNFSVLLSRTRFQAAWFGRFWADAGPGVRETGEARVIPLLEGRVRNGHVVDISSSAVEGKSDDGGGGISGVVLEVGPGSGLWASVFAHPSLAKGITKIYGVEPNAAHHVELRQRIAAAGLGDKYEIVPCGIEDLAASGRVDKGSVDCVVSILCMCSIPEPAKHAEELFGYLKDGGRWFVYEHVRCESEKMRESGLGMRMYQGEFDSFFFFFLLYHLPIMPLSYDDLEFSIPATLYELVIVLNSVAAKQHTEYQPSNLAFVNLFWPHIIGGCELCRNTPKSLLEAGAWTKIDLAQPKGEPWYHPLPHILGTLTK